ncbi:unnamed protein product [Malus baccata var. baccata]
MVQEFNALQQCGTWSLVPYHPKMNLLPNKWVFKIKRHADGSIERHKARLVANGFHQKPGVDYTETFSPLAKHSTMRLVLSLIRSIYGLKQTPRAWFQRFSEFLLQLGFQESTCDYSLFVFNQQGVYLILLIYVDDILITVNQVCQFMHSPTTTHWTAVKRILRYLKATYNHGLLYKPGGSQLIAYSDADYAGNPDTRHSTGGYCIYLGPNLVSWSSKKQKTVSRSHVEAEYRQLAYSAAKLSWLRSLFRDLHFHLVQPTIWCDNVSSIALASNPVFHSRTKHLEVDYHYVREKVVRGQLLVNYICSQDQLADLFTKGLSSFRFKLLVSKLPVVSPTVSLRGDVRPSHGTAAVNTTSTV